MGSSKEPCELRSFSVSCSSIVGVTGMESASFFHRFFICSKTMESKVLLHIWERRNFRELKLAWGQNRKMEIW